MYKIVLINLFIIVKLCAFIDDDFDGVANSKDKCLDTPFTKLVDENGCPYDKKYFGKINFEFEYTNLDNSKIKNYYLNYEYNKYLFSYLSGVYEYNNISFNLDRYFSFAYKYDINNFNIQNGLAINLDRSNNYYLFMNLSKDINNHFSYDIASSYNISKNSSTNIYENYLIYSLAIIYSKIDYEISIGYSNSGSNDNFINDYEDINLVYTYKFNRYFYTNISYDYSLNSNNSISLAFGFNYE